MILSQYLRTLAPGIGARFHGKRATAHANDVGGARSLPRWEERDAARRRLLDRSQSGWEILAGERANVDGSAGPATRKALALISAEKSLREAGDMPEARRLADLATQLLDSAGPCEKAGARLEREELVAELVTSHLAHGQDVEACRLAKALTSPWRAFRACLQIAAVYSERGDVDNAQKWVAAAEAFTRGNYERERLRQFQAALEDDAPSRLTTARARAMR